MNKYLIIDIYEYLNKHYRCQHSLKYSEVVNQYNTIVDPYYIIEEYETHFDDFSYNYHLNGYFYGIVSYDNVTATINFRCSLWDSFKKYKLNAIYNYRDPVNSKIYYGDIMRLGKAVGMLPANYYYTYPDRESLLRIVSNSI